MKKFILILGGARSGKSSYAVELAKKFSKRTAFIATAISSDEEMKMRINLHKTLRPRYWKVIEEGKDVPLVLQSLKNKYEIVVIDCLGFLVSNLLINDLKDKQIERKIKILLDTIKKSKITVILVSNEVGCGIIPDNLLARRFRDLLGWANQSAVKKADEVIFMQSGIPIVIKATLSDLRGRTGSIRS